MRLEDELTQLMTALTDDEAAELIAGYAAPVDPAAEARIRAAVQERAFPRQKIRLTRTRFVYTAAAACLIVCLSVAAALFLANRPQRPPVAPGSETVTETTASGEKGTVTGGGSEESEQEDHTPPAQTTAALQTETAQSTEAGVTAQTTAASEGRTESVSATAEPPNTESNRQQTTLTQTTVSQVTAEQVTVTQSTATTTRTTATTAHTTLTTTTAARTTTVQSSTETGRVVTTDKDVEGPTGPDEPVGVGDNNGAPMTSASAGAIPPGADVTETTTTEEEPVY